MKVEEIKIFKQSVVQIYLREKEKNNIEIQKEIAEIRASHNNVVLFVSGIAETNNSLKQIVNIMANT